MYKEFFETVKKIIFSPSTAIGTSTDHYDIGNVTFKNTNVTFKNTNVTFKNTNVLLFWGKKHG